MPTVSPLPGVENYDNAVHYLADEYAQVHNRLNDLEIYALHDPQRQIVQIIEVSNLFPETGELWPVRFKRTTDFPFDTAQIIMTKDEWQRVRTGAL